MDNQNTNQSLFSLRITENTKTQLRGAAVLAGIAAILSLTSSIISLIRSFMGGNKTTVQYNYEGFNQTRVVAERSENIASTIITLIVSVLLFYFLNRFSRQTKSGLDTSSQETVNSGLGGLSGYLVTIGILLIICLAFFLLLFVLVGSR